MAVAMKASSAEPVPSKHLLPGVTVLGMRRPVVETAPTRKIGVTMPPALRTVAAFRFNIPSTSVTDVDVITRSHESLIRAPSS